MNQRDQEKRLDKLKKMLPSSLCNSCIKSDVCVFTEHDTGKGGRRVEFGTGIYRNEIEIFRRVLLCLKHKDIKEIKNEVKE